MSLLWAYGTDPASLPVHSASGRQVTGAKGLLAKMSSVRTYGMAVAVQSVGDSARQNSLYSRLAIWMDRSDRNL
jgi:hypothetical protein